MPEAPGLGRCQRPRTCRAGDGQRDMPRQSHLFGPRSAEPAKLFLKSRHPEIRRPSVVSEMCVDKKTAGSFGNRFGWHSNLRTECTQMQGFSHAIYRTTIRQKASRHGAHGVQELLVQLSKLGLVRVNVPSSSCPSTHSAWS